MLKSCLELSDYRGFDFCWSLRSKSSRSTAIPPPAAQLDVTAPHRHIVRNLHKGALFLRLHPLSIAHGPRVKGPSIGANHTVAAVNSPIASSLLVVIACAGVMSMCANQSCPCRHNFGGCLARIAIKGAIVIYSYTRFQRTGPRWFPTSSAGAAEPTGPSVPSTDDAKARISLVCHRQPTKNQNPDRAAETHRNEILMSATSKSFTTTPLVEALQWP